MADNLAWTPGVGATIRTQDKGGVHVQAVQIDVGNDTTVTPLVLGQAITANSVPVALASDATLPVTNAGTFVVQATLAAGATTIAKAEDAASASADVGVPAMAIQLATPTDLAGTDADYAMLQMSAGRLWASAKIDTALPAGTNAIGKLASNAGVTIGAVEIAAAQTLATVTTVGAVTSLTNALPAGTNAIGKLAANSGVDIGDVDVTSVIPGTGATNLGKAEDAAHTSGDVGVMAMSVRQDAAAALSGTDADYQPLITDGSGRLHVNVGNTVTVASHAVTNAGTFATQVDGAALTSLQLIDDVVKAEDAAHSSGDVGVMALTVRRDTATQGAGTAADYSTINTDANGKVWTRATPEGTLYETVAASQTDQVLGPTGATGDYLAGVLIVPASTSPGVVQIQDGAGTEITIFAGGASSLSNLVPFMVPLGIISTGVGGWSVTTGASVSCIGIGTFT